MYIETIYFIFIAKYLSSLRVLQCSFGATWLFQIFLQNHGCSSSPGIMLLNMIVLIMS